MGKQKKRHGAVRSGRDESFDKPDYAADMLQKQKKEKKPAVKETDIYVEERLNRTALQNLAKMKEQLLADANATAKIQVGKQALQKNKPVGKSAKEKIAEDPNASFAELFDPTDDDEHSFVEMLKDSKLDWHKYKD
jgi:hypothetical protein